jgi:hypothetical protein
MEEVRRGHAERGLHLWVGFCTEPAVAEPPWLIVTVLRRRGQPIKNSVNKRFSIGWNRGVRT